MADADLQQINGTPNFPSTATVLADELLVPTDGPKITAASNAAGQAPVKKSLVKLKDLVLGLRGAIFGDFAGAVMRSVKSLQVDLTGGALSVAPDGTILVQGTHGTPSIDAYDGDIQAQQGNFHSLIGNLLLDLGSAIIQGNVHATSPGSVFRAGNGAGQRTEQGSTGLKWLTTSTGATDANPARGNSIKNQLVAKNTPKHWGRIKITAGAITSQKGSGAWTASIVDLGMAALPRYVVRVTMADLMDDVDYHVSPLWYSTDNHQEQAGVLRSMTTAYFDLFVMLAGAATYPDINIGDSDFGFEVMGQQTT